MGNSKDDFFKRLGSLIKERNNPTDLKASIIGKVVQLNPIIVQIEDGLALLEENEEMEISEWFRFRCNIDKDKALSSDVPDSLTKAKAITEVHSQGGLQFKALTTKTVFTNDTFEVECVKKGAIGNVAAYSIVVIPTTIQGIVSVANPEEFTNGYDKETKEALLERYYIDLRTPAACGNKYHYKKWALNVAGVGKVKVKPLWNGNNTVKVVILNSNNEIAGPELVEEVQKYIDPYTLDDEGNKVGWGCGNGEAPIGAYCTVTTAESLKLNFNIPIKKNEKYSNDTLQNNVEKAIKEYLDSQKFKELPSGTDFYYLSYSKLASKITLAEGVDDMDIDTFKINNLQDNIIVYDNNEKTQVAEIGTVTITLID